MITRALEGYIARRDRPRFPSVHSICVTAAALAVFGLAAPADAAFPGANGRLAFSATNPGDASTQVYTAGESGRRLWWVTDTGTDPAFSADGRWIAYSDGGVEVITASADQMNQKKPWRPRPVTRRGGVQPAWSPDGRSLIYTACRRSCVAQPSTIYTVRLDGKARRRLAGGSGAGWSSRGLIAFERRSKGGDVDIYTMTARGRRLHAITRGGGNDLQPDWAPDGSSLVFARGGDLYRVARRGGPVQQLTGQTAGERESDADPVFSPDGKKIAFSRDGMITVIDAAGTNPHAVDWGCSPDDGCWAWSPSWQPRPPSPVM